MHKEVKKLDHSHITGGNVKWHSHSGRQCDNFLKTKQINCHMAQQLHCWAFIPEKLRLCPHKNLYINVYGNFIHNSPNSPDVH